MELIFAILVTRHSAVDFVVDSLEGESFSAFFWGGAGLVLMRSKDGCSENSHFFLKLVELRDFICVSNILSRITVRPC